MSAHPAPEFRASTSTPPTRHAPHTHLLSNGRYTVMLTAAGSGYSQWQGCAITRWREDVTRDNWGAHVYLRDVASGNAWSLGQQPLGGKPDDYRVAFDEGHAQIDRRDGSVSTNMDVLVPPDIDGELRRLSLTNHGDSEREIEITTYAELVLSPANNDAAHPAFSKLFVQTQYVAQQDLLLATRRKRVAAEPSIWAAQWLDVEGLEATTGTASTPQTDRLQWTTDRAAFIGRGRDLHAPAALDDDALLDGRVGTVLDPIFSLRRRVRVAPGQTVHLQLWTITAPSRGAGGDVPATCVRIALQRPTVARGAR